ncbi:MAG: cell division regulator GpsB [Faecalibacillus sp.]
MEYKVVLSPKKIVSKEFKVDFKGYNADEVDHFLDQIVKDYEAFAGMLNESYDRIEQLERRLAEQKNIVARLEREKAMQDDNLRALESNASSNVDILKRLSLLEKVVFSQNK